MKINKVFKSQEGRNAVFEAYVSLMAQWPVPYEELMIPTQYGSTYTLVSGEKQAPPLVLLHGTASNSTMWMGDILAYSRHYRVYAVDISGSRNTPGLVIGWLDVLELLRQAS